MSNIILTTECQRKCKYCFAKDNQDAPMKFEMDNFIKAVDWLVGPLDCNIERIGLLGGEPTTHPEFINFLDYTLSKRINTNVFTNAMIEDEHLIFDIIKTAQKNEVKHSDNLNFCVNVNEDKYRSRKERRLQTRFLEILGRVSVLSFNIFEPSCNFGFLVDLIKKFHMIPAIRFGLAAPLGNRNKFIEPKYYSEIAEKLTKFSEITKKNKIKIGLDCGFPKCMFTEDQRDTIIDAGVDLFSFDCGPTIDIYPNLEVGCCYPLSRIMKVKIEDFASYHELYEYWEKEIEKLKPIYDKCYECQYYANRECGGGCKAHRING